VINYIKKFIFIHIPKTAGTSIEEVLTDENCSLKQNQWSNKGFSSPLNHLTLGQLMKHEKLTNPDARDFFKFAFVRNPWDKTISECFCPHIQAIFKNCENTKDKIKTVCHWSSKGGYGGHCRKQTDFIKHAGIELDFVGRFENLHQDYNHICTALGVPPITLPHKFNSHRLHYSTYFDNETEDLVREIYKKDIENFNYKYL